MGFRWVGVLSAGLRQARLRQAQAPGLSEAQPPVDWVDGVGNGAPVEFDGWDDDDQPG
jgi:hypothetical protein